MITEKKNVIRKQIFLRYYTALHSSEKSIYKKKWENYSVSSVVGVYIHCIYTSSFATKRYLSQTYCDVKFDKIIACGS